MNDGHPPQPADTAVRTALRRALHMLADPPPHVFEDEVGLELAAPDEGWRERPDMGGSRARSARDPGARGSSKTSSPSQPPAA